MRPGPRHRVGSRLLRDSPTPPPAPEPWSQPAAPAGDGQQWGQPAPPPATASPATASPATSTRLRIRSGPGRDPGWAGAAAAGPTYAHWGLRVGSFLVDWLIPTVAFVVLLFVGGAVSAASGSDGGGVGFGIFIGLAYLVLIGFWAWNSCLRQGRTGRSVGKSVVGTALVRAADGSYIRGGMAFVRELAHVLDGLPCYSQRPVAAVGRQEADVLRQGLRDGGRPDPVSRRSTDQLPKSPTLSSTH